VKANLYFREGNKQLVDLTMAIIRNIMALSLSSVPGYSISDRTGEHRQGMLGTISALPIEKISRSAALLLGMVGEQAAYRWIGIFVTGKGGSGGMLELISLCWN